MTFGGQEWRPVQTCSREDTPTPYAYKRAVRILLECFLVTVCGCRPFEKVHTCFCTKNGRSGVIRQTTIEARAVLGSVYTKRQRHVCDITPNKMQCSGTTLQCRSRMGFATHFQASPLISMRAESLASSQR